jgi:hypothetical protein
MRVRIPSPAPILFPPLPPEINLQNPSPSPTLRAYPVRKVMPFPSSSPSAIPINPLARALTGRVAQTPPSALASQPVHLNTSKSSLREVLPPQRADLTHSGAETTQELDVLLRKGTSSIRIGLAEVAYSSFRLHEKDEWGTLGFASEADYFASLGYAESTWDSYLLLGERLNSLTLAMMQEIPAASARLLATISAKIWPEFAWVEEARILAPREFALLVKDRRAQAGAGRGIAEPKTHLELSIPLLQKDEFEHRLDSLRRREKLPTQAAVLDFALRSAEKDPARSGVVERLAQMAEELARTWDGVDIRLGDLADPETESLLAAKRHAQDLLRQIQKSLRELRRYATSPKIESRIQPRVQPQVESAWPAETEVTPSLPLEVPGDKYSSGTSPAQA